MKTIFKSILFTIAIVAVSLFAGCIPKYEPLNKNDINNYKTMPPSLTHRIIKKYISEAFI